MNNSLLIHTHLGLGDHFVCNGLVRYLVEVGSYDSYSMPAKHHNLETVKQMYSDLQRLRVFGVDSDASVYHGLKYQQKMLRIGFEYMDYSVNFDQSFYGQIGLSLETKRTHFKVNRDPEREQACMDHYKVHEKYIFVHDTSSVGKIDLKINSDLTVISPEGFDFTLIDYLGLIERAEEIHCLDSSFMNMIDLAVNHDRMYFHDIKGFPLPLQTDKWKHVNYGGV